MPSPAELHAQARDLLLKGDTAGGISDLKSYLEAEPDDEAAWLDLGAAYASLGGHWIQACDALRAAVDLDGSLVDARLAYARALLQIKRPDDAAFQLLQAAKVDPDDARVLEELGIVFYDKRLYDKAVVWLSKAVDVAPERARSHYALGLAHEARRDMGGAVASYREAVRRDPSFVSARSTLADALASMGEHEGAVAELEAVLTIDRSNEQAAHNRDVLRHALDEMRSHRLLGHGQQELEASALIAEGAFRKKGPVPGAGAGLTVRYAAPLVEVFASFDVDHAIRSLLLVLTDPDRAAQSDDDTFKVTVIAGDGHREPVSFATAVSLTFLRESLGCPMTQASAIYARLLGGEATFTWAGATLTWDTVPRPDKPSEPRHGIRVSR